MADQIAVFWQAYGGIAQLLVLILIGVGVWRLAQVVTQRQLLDRDWSWSIGMVTRDTRNGSN
jgi:hypothetical protein